jgi:acyl-CoA thioesterase-1
MRSPRSSSRLSLAHALALLVVWSVAWLGASAPAHATTRVLFLGDSLTEGSGVAKSAAYPALVEAKLKAKGHADVECVNAGVGGSTTASALSRLRWHLNAKDKPAVLVLALGGNDGLRGLDVKVARQSLVDTIRLAKDKGLKVLLAGMMMPPNYGKEYTEAFKQMYVDVAKEEAVGRIPFLLEGVAGDPSLNLPDGIHPNEKGYRIVAETVLRYLEPLLAP